jgi:hypothetical protein
VGPTNSYPHISTAIAGLTHSGERRSTRKVYLARIIIDLRTVHNKVGGLYGKSPKKHG